MIVWAPVGAAIWVGAYLAFGWWGVGVLFWGVATTLVVLGVTE